MNELINQSINQSIKLNKSNKKGIKENKVLNHKKN